MCRSTFFSRINSVHEYDVCCVACKRFRFPMAKTVQSRVVWSCHSSTWSQKTHSDGLRSLRVRCVNSGHSDFIDFCLIFVSFGCAILQLCGVGKTLKTEIPLWCSNENNKKRNVV